MDFSAIKISKINTLSHEEIIQEYEKLFNYNQQLREAQEKDKQKIYELTRNLDTANAAEKYLFNELETITSNQSTAIGDIQKKHNQEVEVLKKTYSDLSADYSALEKKSEQLQKRNDELLQNLKEIETRPSSKNSSFESNDNEKELIEKENLNLLAELDNCRQKIKRMTLDTAQQEKTFEILREEIKCLQEISNQYKSEFEEKLDLLEKAGEKIIELKVELASKQTVPENENKKGNSLFAEVDDQRQSMKKLLSDQKHDFIEMKKKYNESQYEIRRLKRENSALHNELQTCSTIFLNAEKNYQSKLNERINQLIKEKERLESKLAWTQDKLILVSSENGMSLVDSMFRFCKEETQNLQERLKHLHIQNTVLEENLQNSQEELAKWRFEALKLRCILKHRESILEENNIKFEKSVCSNTELNESECKNAQPNVFFTNKVFNMCINEDEISKNNVQSNEQNKIKSENCLSSQLKLSKVENAFEIHEDTTLHLPSIKQNKYKENVQKESIENAFEIHEDTTLNLPSIKQNKSLTTFKIDDKENVQKESVNDFNIFEDTTNTNLNLLLEKKNSTIDEEKRSYNVLKIKEDEIKTENFCAPPLLLQKNTKDSTILKNNFELNKVYDNEIKKPILIQNRDILDLANQQKSVKFEENVGTSTAREDKPNIKTSIKKNRIKSNVVVKRIIIPNREKKTEQN